MNTTDIHPLTERISDLDKSRKKRVFETWDKAELEALQNMTLIEEGMKIYKEYSRRPKMLVTMQGKTAVKIVLERFNMEFDYVVTREDSLNRANQLRIASDRLGIAPRKTLFVGNTDEDFRAANAGGYKFLRIE